MVTVAKANYEYDIISNESSYVSAFRGLSTDTKPMNVAVNSTFLELDTGKGFYFCNGAWHEYAENKPDGMVVTSALIG